MNLLRMNFHSKTSNFPFCTLYLESTITSATYFTYTIGRYQFFFHQQSTSQRPKHTVNLPTTIDLRPSKTIQSASLFYHQNQLCSCCHNMQLCENQQVSHQRLIHSIYNLPLTQFEKYISLFTGAQHS